MYGGGGGARTHRYEFLLEVLFGVVPGGYGVAEEEEVVHNTLGVQGDDIADAAEGTVLLVVVSNVSQGETPGEVSKRS